MADDNKPQNRILVTRSAAIAAGMLFYDNGMKCPLDHESSVRYAITGKCLECCKLEQVRFRDQRRAERAALALVAIPNAARALRKQAKADGLLFYDPGEPCPRNHASTVRVTASGKCLECRKEEGTRYQSRRAAHYRANAAAAAVKTKEWRLANPEKHKKLNAEYRERHRIELRAKNVAYRKTHTTPLLDRRVRENVRRSRKAKAGGSFTPEDIKRLYSLQRGMCAYCRKTLKSKYQIDHIIPVRLGGHSNPSNLQLLCAPCNWSKQGKHPIDFVQTLGLLV